MKITGLRTILFEHRMARAIGRRQQSARGAINTRRWRSSSIPTWG